MNQYIITEEDICTIRDYILGAFYEGESKEKMYDHIKAEFSVIRSHPYRCIEMKETIVALFHRIEKQPEFKDAFVKLPNAERSYMAGDFYNIIVGCSHPYQSEREKVLDELVSMLIESCSENYEPNGMGCKCCPFLIVYDDGLQCAVKELQQQAGEP
jgi:hypothetical protein